MGGGRLPDALDLKLRKQVLKSLCGCKIIKAWYSQNCLKIILEDGRELKIEATLWSEVLQTKVGSPFLRMTVGTVGRKK